MEINFQSEYWVVIADANELHKMERLDAGCGRMVDKFYISKQLDGIIQKSTVWVAVAMKNTKDIIFI
ncbi:MAG: hypothetical protein ABIP51_17880 [Bacteroidia bacterium]